MNKLFYVILHGSVYKDRKTQIIETWGKNVNYIFYSDYDDLENKVIKVSNNNHYNSNEEKHINVINFLCSKNLDFEWYFFCDDDTFVNTENLNSYIEIADKQSVHGLIINCWGGDSSLKYCSGGAGYLINRDILKKISNGLTVLGTGYSDVTLGLKIRELGINLIDNDKFKGHPPEFYNIPESDYKKYITFHYIKNKERVYKIFEIINK